MTREISGRLVITCDRCNARLDLGPARTYRPHRSPSGWLATGDNQHVCGLCSPRHTAHLLRRFG
jgi:hypothetical protein